MLEPLVGNHNDLYDIEVQFEVDLQQKNGQLVKVVTATLENTKIEVNSRFLNADAGFDSKDFRSACVAMDINANVCFNKSNWKVDRDEHFD